MPTVWLTYEKNWENGVSPYRKNWGPAGAGFRIFCTSSRALSSVAAVAPNERTAECRLGLANLFLQLSGDLRLELMAADAWGPYHGRQCRFAMANPVGGELDGRFHSPRNINHFRDRSEADPTTRSTLQKLLVEEEDKLAKGQDLRTDPARGARNASNGLRSNRRPLTIWNATDVMLQPQGLCSTV
jgi:hypothetical protein